MYNYYFALASVNFLTHEEPVEEILRERTNYYNSINKDIDFWLIRNSDFIKNNITFNQSQPIFCAAIVSSDKDFIQWLKLRLIFVVTGEFRSHLDLDRYNVRTLTG
uniref:Ycf54 n=1 Tax=Gelidium vagum TaxID=35171 RepID=A0A141SE65_GELVA|nr:hypothetical protein Gvag_133 [Gelidium vagum]AMK96583.1 hypothetical protein Gvag_133 [Gelidium vagum]